MLTRAALQKQEAYQAVVWASFKPGSQSAADAEGAGFFSGFQRGDEEPQVLNTVGESPDADPTVDEPVMAYTAEDIQAGLTRSTLRIESIYDPTQKEYRLIPQVTHEGNALISHGLVTKMPDKMESILAKDYVPGMWDISFDQELAGILANLLTGWLQYDRATARFGIAYGLGDRGGGTTVEHESRGWGQAHRGLPTIRIGYDEGGDGMAAYGLLRREEVDRGTHGTKSQVAVEDIAQWITDERGSAVQPSSLPPVDAANVPYWDRDLGYIP